MNSVDLLRAAADTQFVRQVPVDRTGLEQVVFVAAGLSQVVTLVVVVLLAVIFYRMWRAQQAMHEQLARLASKVDPVIASASAAAENVRVLTDVVRRDAVAAADALSEATVRVRDAVSGIADRIDEFGDLLSRVHDKADTVAEIADAALHTVKLGSAMLQSRHRHSGEHTPHADRARPAREARDDRDVRDDARGPQDAPPSHDGRAGRESLAEQLEAELDEPRRLADDGDGESPYADGTPDQTRRSRRRRRRRRGPGGGNSSGGQPTS